MSLTKLAVRRLERVAKHILAHPEQLDMSSWCGGICCIGGHLVAQSRSREAVEALMIPDYQFVRRAEAIRRAASDLIGVDYFSAVSLFYGPHWPRRFKEAFYDPSTTGRKQARVAAARIHAFIKEQGVAA